jgi:hypothetical protein
MLTVGMSTRAVAREFNVNFSTISCLQCYFREFGRKSNQPQNCRPCVTKASPGPPYPASSPAVSSEGILRSFYVCNKAFLRGKTNSDWMGLATQWVGLCPPMAAPLPSHEIHRVGSNEFISDFFI